MTQHLNSPRRPQQRGRVLGWVALTIGVLLVLGTISSVANGYGAQSISSLTAP